MNVSDFFSVFVCKNCRMFSTGNVNKKIFFCKKCKKSDICKVKLPYAAKQLIEELEAVHIFTKL